MLHPSELDQKYFSENKQKLSNSEPIKRNLFEESVNQDSYMGQSIHE